jgi:hypothetical protein
MDKIADRNSWKALPLPAQRAKLTMERAFTEQEYRRLAQGFIPQAMEDKWFIFMETDVLFFHRSWTGVCMYEVHFDPQRAIAAVWVNRDPQHYPATDQQHDQQLLGVLLDKLLQEPSTPVPMPSSIPGRLPPGVIQAGVSGTGDAEEQHDKKESWTTKIKQIFQRKGK